MKQYKFRGKSIEDKQWVYGSLITNGEVAAIMVEGTLLSLYPLTAIFVQVTPETVGMFTGITDKNGKDVFSGDVVKTGSDTRTLYEVIWANDCWYLIDVRGGSDMFGPFGRNISLDEPKEVVGNVIDNPDLIQSKP